MLQAGFMSIMGCVKELRGSEYLYINILFTKLNNSLNIEVILCAFY